MALLVSTEVTAATGSLQVSTKRALFGGVVIETNGTNDAVVNVYNSASGGTTPSVIPQITVTGSDNYGGVILPHPIICNEGLYVTISGTGAVMNVLYRKG